MQMEICAARNKSGCAFLDSSECTAPKRRSGFESRMGIRCFRSDGRGRTVEGDVSLETKTESRLNDRQREAVDTEDGRVLVLAGAGSGKTTVLTERAAQLIRSGKARASEILAITFTNKAAKEMKERIAAKTGFESLGNMWVQTFHATCGRILRMCPAPGFTKSFVIYDAEDSKKLIVDIIKALGVADRYKIGPIKNLISRYKNTKDILGTASEPLDEDGYVSLAAMYDSENAKPLTFGEWAMRHSFRLERKVLDQIWNAYQAKLLKENAMDFDDMLLNAVRVLRENPAPRKYLQNRFKYIMVDEYQDTNPVQYELIRLLSAVHGNLFCVGDDDQSIYGFRGTDISIIRGFQRDFPDAKIIRLEENYRSTMSILSAANSVISHNTQRLGKTLWSQNEGGALPVIVETENEFQEAEAIVAEIQRLHNEENVSYSSNAVLYRTHKCSRAIEEAFVAEGIPYRIFGGVGFYGRKEIKDMMAYLQLLVNPAADQQLLRIINVPKRGVGPKKIAALWNAAAEHGLPVLEVMRKGDEYCTDASLKRICREFVALYDSLAGRVGKEPVGDIVKAVYEDTGYRRMLKDSADPIDADRMENVRELVSAAAIYDEEGDGDLTGFLQKASLMTDQDRADDADDVVELMTVHAAKGLEFDNVYVAGLADGVFPHFVAVKENNLEEERRLCYVAITRAKKRLMLLWSETRYEYGDEKWYKPSPFLEEIPGGAAIRV